MVAHLKLASLETNSHNFSLGYFNSKIKGFIFFILFKLDAMFYNFASRALVFDFFAYFWPIKKSNPDLPAFHKAPIICLNLSITLM